MRKIYFGLLAAMVLMAATNAAKAGSKAFAYQMGDENSKFGFVTFDVADFAATTVVKSTYADGAHVSAGEYLDGKYYAFTVFPDDFGFGISAYTFDVYDATTFAQLKCESEVNDERRVVDMTYDYTTNTMYAIAEDKAQTSKIGRTSLCIVDLKDGKLTRVGYAGDLKSIDGYGRETETVLVTLACDAKGNLYAMSDFRQFYKIDKYTGAATQIGTQHKLATDNQFQSMSFDKEGVLYWAQQTPDYGWFTTIDPATGEPTKLGTLGANAQITGLFFEKDLNKTAPAQVENLTATVAADDHNSVNLSWTLPTKDMAGNAVTVTAVKVYRLGYPTPVAELDGAQTSFTDTDVPDGDAVYEVQACAGSMIGVPATVSVFAGYDQLKAVNDLEASISGNTVTVTWSAPTATVNGGYADYSDITYNIYKNQGDKDELVAMAISELEYKEDVEPGAYTYTVEPICGGVAGVKATSNVVKLEAVAIIPYSTGFEDTQDGPMWKTINDHTNTSYGWGIELGYAYQRLDGKYARLKTGGSADAGRDWMISPAIKFDKAGSYKISFYANGGSYDTHSFDILLGDESGDVDSFKTTVASYADAKFPNWTDEYSTTFDVAEAGTYRLGFYGKTTSTFATLKIDNLSIVVNDGSGIAAVAGKAGVVAKPTAQGIEVSATAEIASVKVVNMSGAVVKQLAGEGATYAHVALTDKGVFVVVVALADGSTTTVKVVK